MVYIFWDNDGILVDTERFYFQSTQEIMAGLGVELTGELYREYFLTKNTGAWHLASALGHSSDVIQEKTQQRNDRYAELIAAHDNVIAGAEDVLHELYGHCEMAIVTSSRAEHFELIHQRSNCLQYVNFVLWSGMYVESKPSPAPYIMALEKADCVPSEVVVIEDSLRGLLAAKAAGLRCWVIPNELTSYQDFSMADAILQDIREVPDRIKSL
ncbi:MAG: HAD family phosphatase [Planctomycetes bacterium]|nr:HAD family phosphatase [Planctomycetota bacterium]